MKKLSLLLILAILSVVTAGAAEYTLEMDFLKSLYGFPQSSAAEPNYPDTYDLTDTEDVTITVRKGTGSIYYKSGSGIRLYGQWEGIDIKAPAGGYITKVQYTLDKGMLYIDGSSSNPWTGEKEVVTLTKQSSSFRYLSKLTITYTKPGEAVAPGEVTFNPATGASIACGSKVAISSQGAESLTYTVNGGEATTVTGNTANVVMPATAGECTVNVTATNETGTTDGSATYTLFVPAPGAITFGEDTGIVTPGALVKVSSSNADKIVYTINNGAESTLNGASGNILIPETPGVYNVKVTATNASEYTTEGSIVYIVPDTNLSGSFVKCLTASDLKAGTPIYIGDPNQDPFTVMSGTISGNNLAAVEETANADGSIAANNAGQVLYLIPANDGTWYLETADKKFLYSASSPYLALRANQQSEFTIAIDNDGLAKISTMLNGSPLYVAHSSTNGNQIYTTYYENGIASMAERTFPCLYIPGTSDVPVPAPAAVTFDPAAGDVEAGTVVTATATGATHISYTYNGKTEEADAETINITIDAEGTVTVTASNEGGTVTGEAAYTIKQTPVIPAPAEVTFTPAAGEVEAGTVVTATATGATHISYTYNGKTEEADAETVNITIDAEGTVTVTASNEGGTVTGEAAYTIKQTPIEPDPNETVVYTSLNADSETCDWVLSSDYVMWWQEDGSHMLDFGFEAATAYDPNPIELPNSQEITITARFEQNQAVEGTKFLVRENGTEAWDELDIVSNEARTDFSPASVNISDYKGKTVQVGFSFPESMEQWDVRNLKITSKIGTGIDAISAEANAPVYFYNLQGMRVNAENMTPGIYIRQQGRTTTKVLVK